MTATVIERPARVARNGVDVPTLAATLGVVAQNPALAKFQFRADGEWISGVRSVATMSSFSGAGGEHEHKAPYSVESDHPAVLCGTDNGPAPVEFLLAALSACITAGIGNIASMRGIDLEAVESEIVGDIDLQGIFGQNPTTRNGFQGINATFRVKGEAQAAALLRVVEQSVARSAVFDVLTNGVPVSIKIEAA